MKALTIHQPYASLIFGWPGLDPAMVKRIENRTWSTRYRGPLLIHAGTSTKWIHTWEGPMPHPLLVGVILGSVDLVSCWQIASIRQAPETFPLAWLKHHIHATGPICWVLRHPRRILEPIPFKGQQGLYEIPDDVLAEARLEQKCRVCGCTELDACPGGCSWAEENLCGRCSTIIATKNLPRSIHFNCLCGQPLAAMILRGSDPTSARTGEIHFYKLLEPCNRITACPTCNRITACPNCLRDFSKVTVDYFFREIFQ